MTVPAIRDIDFQGRGVPWCTKCNKPVENVERQTPIEIDSYYRFPTHRHTGEVIITFSCHGESFTISNWRGILP
jgi:hypothetical protein